MPTGYTEKVARGEVTSLKDFAMICARGMGALISMRDMPSSAEIPEKFEPSDYNLRELEEAQRELNVLEAMMPEQLDAAAAEENAENIRRQTAYEEKLRRQYDNYTAMLEKVIAWKNPPEGLRSFMMSQLNSSIDFDCPNATIPSLVEPLYNQKKLTGQEWKAARKQQILKDISYHSEAYAKELERVAERNAWVEQLRESLKDA